MTASKQPVPAAAAGVLDLLVCIGGIYTCYLSVPLSPFAFSAFSYLGAMLCSNEALKYVNYPTQALGKSCKMIPVMLTGVLLGRKKYSWKEYVSVILITAGIVIFQLGKDSSKGGKQQTENSVYGLGLLFTSLFLDGLTGSGQEQMVELHKPSVHQQMLNTNIWAVIYTGIGYVGSLLISLSALPLLMAQIYQSLLFFSMCSALGQNFIYFTLQRFSALTCTTITTTRKFFTILASVLYFGNKLADQQWVGVGVVFTGIGIELTTKYSKYGAKKADAKKTI
ncbi:hypothetical protein DYB32_001613 [Aphanomyces invadans]|uniref:Uncharacterized protein n=1 Tax=Aphanomyces invadans TaxID=157072 RepID=A0A418B5S7_9STRA|nr:hypothetical protein DYB32_001613 [Aphanomyces invadans]